MSSLYPAYAADRAEHLDVGDGHAVYFEQAGADNGLPVVFLHGGPGSGCKPSHRQFFNPKKFRSVLIDQRGSGKSTPFGGVESNTTQLLANDLEKIRKTLSIDKWILFGGSWGAALALYYAEHYPQHVSGIVLRGTFLARRYDVDWFFEKGASRLLPREWDAFVHGLEPFQRAAESVQDCIHRCTFAEDNATADAVAALWGRWSEAVVMYSFDKVPSQGEPEATSVTRAKTRIEMHYAKNNYFIPDNYLLENASSLPDVPIKIIHGLRDITCTPDAGWALHKTLPESQFELLRNAGHLSGETAMTEALVKAADDLATLLS